MNSNQTRLAELHQLCDQDYAKGEFQRATAQLPPYIPSATFWPAPKATDLDVAIHAAQQVLGSDQLATVREALRLLLRALGAQEVAGR